MIINVCGETIGEGQKPFVVAELSGNHNQSLDRAKELIDAAADAGVQAIKLQTYTADTMTLDLDKGEFLVEDPENLWSGYTLHKLYDEAHTPWEWHKELFEYIKSRGCIPFSSPFDESAVDFLETLDCPLYKIASFELTDLPLIEKVARTGKPMVMSTGMATEGEILDAIRCAKNAGNHQLIILKCTSTYPASPEDSNLVTLPKLKSLTGCLVGLSDHTIGVGVAVASIPLGAVLIEKHLTLDRSDGGVDSSFSMEPSEFSLLVKEANIAYSALGRVCFGGSKNEQKSKLYRRSIYVKEDIGVGESFTDKNITIVRPGLGLKPKYWNDVIGKVSLSKLEAGMPLKESDVEGY